MIPNKYLLGVAKPMHSKMNWWAVPLVLCLVGTAGCGSGIDRPRVEFVEGVVTLDGKPLEAATVGLTPVSGGLPAYGNTDAAGVFRLTSSRGGLPGAGAVAGDYRVSVRKVKEELGPAESAENPEATAEPSIEDYERWLEQQQQQNRRRVPRVTSLVPERYTNPETSGLIATIEPGRNRLELKLTSD